jgi:hypothetical protein
MFWERLVEAMTKRYSVDYALDEAGWWVASVREISGCHTQGRTIEQTRDRIREALALFDVPATAELVDHVRLPTPLRRKVDMAFRAKRKAEMETERAQEACQQAVKELVQGGLSLRDAGELLGVSRQRAHKILHGWNQTERGVLDAMCWACATTAAHREVHGVLAAAGNQRSVVTERSSRSANCAADTPLRRQHATVFWRVEVFEGYQNAWGRRHLPDSVAGG